MNTTHRLCLLVAAALTCAIVARAHGPAMALPEASADRDGDSITVLRIAQKPGSWLDRLIDPNYCQLDDVHEFEEFVSHGRYIRRTFKGWDCAFQVGRHPEVRAFPIRRDIRFSTVDGTPNWTGLQVPLLLVDLLVDAEVLSRARAVGFSQGSNGGGIDTFALEELLPFKVGEVTKRDGRVATIFRAYIPLSDQGHAADCPILRATFKPFLLVPGPQATWIRSWDDALGRGLWSDYVVTNFVWQNGESVCLPKSRGLFDRADDILSPE